MPTTASVIYGMSGLRPMYPGGRRQNVRLPDSVTYLKGQVLGEVIGTNEVQSIAIDGTGGTFTLSYGGQATSALAYNATAAVVQAALEALAGIGTGNVSVTKGSTVWTLTHTSGTDGGTFAIRVTIGSTSYKTAALAYDVAAADMELAIEALPNVGATNGTCAGSAGGPYTITFAPSLIASGNIAVTVEDDVTADGGVVEGGVIVVALAQGTYLATFINDLGYRDVATLVAADSLTGGAGTATVAVVTAGSGYSNEQQILAKSGTVSGGTYTLTYSGQETTDLAFDASAATVQAALVALSNLGTGDVTVSGSITTGIVVTFGGSLAGTNVGALTVDNTDITGGGTIVVATTAGGTSASAGQFRAVDVAGSDGRQLPRAVLEYDCAVDASGNHTWGGAAGSADFAATRPYVPVFFEGEFKTEELVGLTPAVLAASNWHLISGTVDKGVIKLP